MTHKTEPEPLGRPQVPHATWALWCSAVARWRLGLGALCLALGACGQAPQAPLAVGVNPWVGYDPLVLARDRGLIDDRQVKVVELGSITEVQRALNNRLLDAAAVTLDEALRLSANGLDLRIVLVFDASDGGDKVVVHPDKQSVSDLRGEFIAVEDSSVGTLMLQRMLNRAGMQRTDVKVVNMEVTGHLNALRTGQVAAAVTFAPVAASLEASGYRAIFSSSDIPGEVIDLLVVKAEVLRERPAAVDELLRGWQRGLRALQQDPDGAATQLARGTDLLAMDYLNVLQGLRHFTLEDSRHWLQGPSPEAVSATRTVSAALIEVGRLQGPPDLAALVDTGPLLRVLDGQVQP